jgi:hypothetical protein
MAVSVSAYGGTEAWFQAAGWRGVGRANRHSGLYVNLVPFQRTTQLRASHDYSDVVAAMRVGHSLLPMKRSTTSASSSWPNGL